MPRRHQQDRRHGGLAAKPVDPESLDLRPRLGACDWIDSISTSGATRLYASTRLHGYTGVHGRIYESCMDLDSARVVKCSSVFVCV